MAAAAVENLLHQITDRQRSNLKILTPVKLITCIPGKISQ
jgi:hypothetical protein